MSDQLPRSKRSDTRGVPLGNIAGLCFVLGESNGPLHVKELAEQAIRLGIIESEPLLAGARFPTRINHHIISLRELNVVDHERQGTYINYRLNTSGYRLYRAVKKSYSGSGEVELNAEIRTVLRPILVASVYVRSRWLKYFMRREEFSYEELISNDNYVTFCRIPPDQRVEALSSKNLDSGYRILSGYWDELILYDKDRREIQHGLRRWTNEAYLTDDRVLTEVAAPFSYLHKENSGTRIFEIESHIVTAWLDPEKDLQYFEELVHQAIDNRQQGNRITIPDLIIELCSEYGYAKNNVKELLTVLFYERGNNFFFERGSKFLVDSAFDLSAQDKPSVYYLKLEGVWRTSLVRYGTSQRLKRNEGRD